jgi:hypothetical protein
MLEPNTDFAVNQPASELCRSEPKLFEKLTQQILRGGVFYGTTFPCLFQPVVPSCAQRSKRKLMACDEREIKDGIEAISLTVRTTSGRSSNIESVCQEDPISNSHPNFGFKRSRQGFRSFAPECVTERTVKQHPVDDAVVGHQSDLFLPTFSEPSPGRYMEYPGIREHYVGSTQQDEVSSALNPCSEFGSSEAWQDDANSHMPMLCSCSPPHDIRIGWYTAAAVWPSYGAQEPLFENQEEARCQNEESQKWH